MNNTKRVWGYFVVILIALSAVIVASIITDKYAIKNVETISAEIDFTIPKMEIEEETDAETSETEEPSAYEADYLYEEITMYSTTSLNIRKGAGIEYEIYKTVPVNTALTILYYDEGHAWEVVGIDGQNYFVSSEYLSFEQVVVEEPVKYYGIWTGAYWHFTPEEIDNQWKGMKKSKPILEIGTTRAWQKYLYEKLKSVGAEWFYKYAVAQAMQESGFNPLNQIGNDSVPDKGLFSFRIWYWNSAYGDIYDYHANINAYVARILPFLNDKSEQGIYRAISQHYQPDGTIHMDYVNYVLGRLNELWEME